METFTQLSKDQDLFQNPLKIAGFINELSVHAEDDESILFSVVGLEAIRPLIKKETVDQSAHYFNFLNILHGLIIPHMNDVDCIHTIVMSVEKAYHQHKKDNASRYFKLALNFLNQLHEAAKVHHDEIQQHAQKLEEIIQKLVCQEQLDELQSKSIELLSTEYQSKAEVDVLQNKMIEEIGQVLEDKKCLDDRQSKLLAKLREELIERDVWQVGHSKEVSQLQMNVEALEGRIETLEDQVNRLVTQVKTTENALSNCKRFAMMTAFIFLLAMVVVYIKVYL